MLAMSLIVYRYPSYATGEGIKGEPRDVDQATVGEAGDEVAVGLEHQTTRAGTVGWATPIIESRVTRAASVSSSMPSLPPGRCGRTM